VPVNVQTFADFCKTIPEWGDSSKSYVFPRDHPNVQNKQNVLAQRYQLSGLCYIHAPVMVQHYLVAMNVATTTIPGMIDISKFIRHSFSAKQLEKHIFNDAGDSSLHMLQSILEPKSIVISSDMVMFEQRLKQFGPGLVAGFKVYDDFYNGAGKHSYAGQPKNEPSGFHAMLLIGVRKDEQQGKTKYLLQNWWKGKQFVEMDDIYLEACTSNVYFVKTPQAKIPTEFPVNFAVYAENENMLDKPECLPENEGPIVGMYENTGDNNTDNKQLYC